MRAIRMVLVSVVVMIVSGCATGPYSPLKSGNLKGSKVIVFEQSDRIPRSVMIAPWTARQTPTNKVASIQAINPAIIEEIIRGALETAPKISGIYANERMNNALIGRRMVFVGYQTNELTYIEKIVRAMGTSVENWTPQFIGLP